jgi:hypothetical protein
MYGSGQGRQRWRGCSVQAHVRPYLYSTRFWIGRTIALLTPSSRRAGSVVLRFYFSLSYLFDSVFLLPTLSHDLASSWGKEDGRDPYSPFTSRTGEHAQFRVGGVRARHRRQPSLLGRVQYTLSHCGRLNEAVEYAMVFNYLCTCMRACQAVTVISPNSVV